MNTLPVNDQRPTRNAQRATSELPNSFFLTPNSSFRRHRLRSGMTMIELVAALALFVVIFGVLLIALNTATNLWRNSRAQRRELPSAEYIADLIADDLYQAATDISESDDPYKSFYLYSPDLTNITPGTVTIHLAFLRPASPRTLIPPGLSAGTRTSLDAVFYTSYAHALFRHVIPVAIDYTHAVTNGIVLSHTFITEAMSLVNQPEVHEALLNFSPTPPDTSSTLLAERIIPTFLGYNRDDPTPKPDDIQSDYLPHYLDFSIHLFNAEEWADYLSIASGTSVSDDDTIRLNQLGTLISRRITFPQAGGSRLP